MTPLELSLVFLLGLTGGLHCIQMCGPIVLSWSISLPRPQALRGHLKYNAGRILTYMLLGAIAGSLGNFLTTITKLASAGRIVSGAAMIVAGVLMIGLFPSNGLINIKQPARFSRWIGRHLLGPNGKFQLGLMLGFLPCGLIYAALLKAVDAGTPVAGALTMLAFGSGTAIALLSLGAASAIAGFRLSRWSTRLAAVFILLTGAILLYRGLTSPSCHVAQSGVGLRPTLASEARLIPTAWPHHHDLA
jgi:sulfite exporter TauE/SafE